MSANTKNQLHITSSKVKESEKQYLEDFYEDIRHFFSKFNQKTVSFSSLSTIKEYFTSNKHVNLKIKAEKKLFITYWIPENKFTYCHWSLLTAD